MESLQKALLNIKLEREREGERGKEKEREREEGRKREGEREGGREMKGERGIV